MTAEFERRMLQAAVALACIVPLAIGADGIVRGAAILKGVAEPVPTDLDSHFRYLSGLLLGVGLVFAACIPRIERHGAVVRALAAIVVVGGLARLAAMIQNGAPGPGHRFGLVMELMVVPAILLWQARVARRFS